MADLNAMRRVVMAGKPSFEVVAQHGAGQTDGLHAGAVGLQGAVFNDVGNEVEILLHGFPTV
jgi:hypothetical protein